MLIVGYCECLFVLFVIMRLSFAIKHGFRIFQRPFVIILLWYLIKNITEAAQVSFQVKPPR